MDRDFKLGPWQVKPSQNCMVAESIQRHLEPKVMAVLKTLAAANGELIEREELIARVWPNQVISNDALNNCIANLRRQLAMKGIETEYIKTIPKQGYQLTSSVVWLNPESSIASNKIVSQSSRSALLKKYPTALVLLIVLLPLILLIVFFLDGSEKQVNGGEKTVSIAVLRFEVFDDTRSLENFADGLAEELIHQLTSIPDLKVVARSTSFQYRASTHSLKQLNELMSVDYFVEGSVRKEQQKKRITIQLIDAKSGYHLWSQVFEAEKQSQLSVQTEISKNISAKLAAINENIVADIKRTHPQSEPAYEKFLQGQAYMRLNKLDAYKLALVSFQQALVIEPDYALAHASIALAKLLLYQFGDFELSQVSLEAQASIDRALKLNPKLAEAFHAQGLLYTYQKDYSSAEVAFVKALSVNHYSKSARHGYGYLLWIQGRINEALPHLRLALELDPRSEWTHFIMANILASQGKVEESIQRYQQCQKLLPDFEGCYRGLAYLYQLMGKLNNARIQLALSAARLDEDDFYQNYISASFYLHSNNPALARVYLQKAEATSQNDYFMLRTKLLIDWRTGKLEQFLGQINARLTKSPRDVELLALSALAEYLAGQCEISLIHYQELLEQSQEYQFSLWDAADGFSHQISQAYCYIENAHSEKAKLIIEKLEANLNSNFKGVNHFPGMVYIRAKLYWLTGRKDEAKQLLLRLEKDSWNLLWQVSRDPIFAGQVLLSEDYYQNLDSKAFMRNNQKVLWVDDRPQNNLKERNTFQAMGVDVDIAVSTQQALSKLAVKKYSVIISDMARPEGSQAGVDLFDQVVQVYPQLAFFIYAGISYPEQISALRKRGITDFVTSPDDLYDKVTRKIFESSQNDPPDQ